MVLLVITISDLYIIPMVVYTKRRIYSQRKGATAKTS